MEHSNFKPTNQPNVDSKQRDINALICEQASQLSVPLGLSKEAAFERLMQRIDSGEKTAKIIKPKFGYWAIGLAASLLLLFGAYWTTIRDVQTEAIAGRAEQKVIILPDGSKVSLNAGSQIAYSQNHFTKKRDLSLTGQAFFEVKKGSHFQINTPNGKVEILGTSLDVMSRNKAFKVTCLTGKVKVTSDKSTEVILPGESVEKQSNGLVKRTEADAEKLSAWRTGEFHYHNAQLISIFAEIERQFNVSVEGVGLETRNFTGWFPNKNLQVALDLVCIPMGLRYEIENNKVVVKDKGK